MWAIPNEDKEVMAIYNKYFPKLDNPSKLSDILQEVTKEDSYYLGIFFQG